MKKTRLMATMIIIACIFAMGCSGKKKEDADSKNGDMKNDYNFGLVTGEGGVNDQGFNQLAWEGYKRLQDEFGYNVKYLESKQESDYGANLDKFADEGMDMIWTLGFTMKDITVNAAKMNPDLKYGNIDSVCEQIPDNMVSVVFRAQESTFLTGYIAGRMTETNHVGFIGAMRSEVIDQFEYGFRAGVAYAAKETGKEIDVDIQYTESFTDTAKNKSISTLMYSNGVDIILPCGATLGSIEAAKEMNKYVIGIDMDQRHLAPNQMITVAMKNVDVAVYEITKELAEGTFEGGTEHSFGLAEGGVGIAPHSDNLVPGEVLKEVEEISDRIINGSILPPKDEEGFEAFLKTL